MEAKMERRYLTGGAVRSTKKGRVEGYAAVFGILSADLGGFRERIRPGAFAQSIKRGDDVRALFNHSANYVLGRTRSGTLRLSEDTTGLFFELDPPDSQMGRDIVTSIRRQDISNCSFSFAAVEDSWSRDGTQRELINVNLFDVSPVTFPAYPGTSVDARTLWPDGPPFGVESRRRSERIAGCYELKGRIYVPTPAPLDPELETERCRIRGRLALLE